jgi:hypothetical protein
MATCYNCGGYKPDGGSCPTCRKIESDRRLAEEQRQANDDIARQNLKMQVEIAAFMAKDSQKKHNELLEQEEVRLKELKKQTQILLEQGLTEEEIYQIGLNFEETGSRSLFEIDDHEVILKLNDRGDFFAEYDNPYVQQKFRQAYKKGVEDRLNRDYSKGPGIEFMSQEAFNIGYTINMIDDPQFISGEIYFPNKQSPRFIFRPESDSEVWKTINEEDGSLNCEWVEPYDSDVLNQSFKAGVEKYLKEQNTAENKSIRLAEIQLEQTKQRAVKVAKAEAAAARAKKRAEKKAEKDSQEKAAKISTRAVIGCVLGGLLGLVMGYGEILATIGVVVGFLSGL